MSTTAVTQHIHAPRAAVYRALLDPKAVATWMVPDGMTSVVHEFEPREGGRFRISLTYEDTAQAGKTTSNTDTFHGRFVRLVPDVLVVEEVEFESGNPAMRGQMMLTINLVDADGGTVLHAVHANLPPGISPADNELGWQMSLGKLARLVEEHG